MSQFQPHRTESSRRDFLKTTGSGLAGTALASALARSAHAGADETIKVALIGCGGRGTGAAAQALSTAGPVVLWAMADAFADRIESSLANLEKGTIRNFDRDADKPLTERMNVPPERQFVGLDAYQKAIDSGVDVVILTSPPGFRPQHFAAAVAAGKHVFMEKPVATDAPGVRQVIATAEEAKRKSLKVGVGLQRHHQQSYLEAMPYLHNGELGDIHTLRCYWNSAGAAKVPPPREGLTELEYQVRNWYYLTWLSGDHIVEQHVHNLDVCNWIKQDHPVEAQGMGGRQVRTGKEWGDIFDHHAVEYTYADGSKMFSQCRHIPNCFNRIAEEVQGTQGAAELLNGSYVIEIAGRDRMRNDRRKESSNPYQVEHDVLFAAIRNNTPHNEAVNGAHSTMTAILGRMTTYSGKVVKWDEAINSQQQLTTNATNWDATPPTLPGPDGFYPIAVPGVTRVV